MNKQRLALLIVAIAGMVATFLPWVNAPIVGSVNGTAGSMGWISLGLFAIPLIISLLSNREETVKGVLLVAAVLPGLVAAGAAVWKMIDFHSQMASVSGDNPFGQALASSVSIGFGLYLIVAAGIAIPLVAFIIKDKKEITVTAE